MFSTIIMCMLYQPVNQLVPQFRQRFVQCKLGINQNIYKGRSFNGQGRKAGIVYYLKPLFIELKPLSEHFKYFILICTQPLPLIPFVYITNHFLFIFNFMFLNQFMQTFSLTLSNYMLVTIAIERHRAVTNPLQHLGASYR